MFKSLKIYIDENIDLENIVLSLVDFGYKRQEACGEEGDFSRRGAILDIFPFSFEMPIRIELEIDKVISIKTFNPSTGSPLWEHKMVIILPVKKPGALKTMAFKEEFPLESFIDLNIGDYVVHNQHGLGRFLGLNKIRIQDKYKDHLVIEYDRQEKLFVPTEQMHLVQKYIAFQVRKPRLNRLGTKEWQRTKDRAKKGIQKLAWETLSLQAMRLSISGFTYSPDTEWQRQFEATFPYKETPDQIKATLDVKEDMESSRPMDRLLCGDVGYGKTEVAMRAAFKTMMDNKQVAYLVPTTILAEQHCHNFSARLQDFPINIQMLCRFKSKSQQRQIIEGLAGGTVDIVIGTHRLLSEDIKFKDLGLVIIDEEQRFGVRAKEKLKTLRLTTDVLTLTATPIPRTLYMSLMGARDLSVINTPPQNRLPIKTIVVEYDSELIVQAIIRELERKGQVYFVHNRIHDIERAKGKIARILPSHIRLTVAHGQMPPRALEKVMIDFLNAKIDVLICTMIIESGIDIPNVNTIIVNNAHTFGLSDLHQLRGRVGRFDRPAYAYFMIPKTKFLDTGARKRLQAIGEYCYLGSGFKIAMEDLEIRGAGNLLGLEQHGFIALVGFDLYCRLLKEAISNFKNLGKYNNG
ncbi:MAG: transcription-repair coupling factor [Candidatus Omnitrophica bacterium]|nr:transcription-repair coupling factor [Candidatus Omnitrophota bacterium]MBU4473053.1 transcription-repair coupling factor [Candidatus Omnitrophota bacterium]MCG2706656.1 transcription-repair coupling factor [Candidatus Omnitrophota bacterium]